METKEERKNRLEELIKVLKNDISIFGASGDDISRLQLYKKELSEI